MLFQIRDDLIDLREDIKKTVKLTKKDIKKCKATLINLLGYNNTLKFVYYVKKKIFNKIKKYGKKSSDLIESVEHIVHRES